MFYLNFISFNILIETHLIQLELEFSLILDAKQMLYSLNVLEI